MSRPSPAGCVFLLACALATAPARAVGDLPAAVFVNPIATPGEDPWVINHQDGYLYCYSRDDAVWVSRASRLQDIGRVPPVKVWQAPAQGPASRDLWAPELHRLDGTWFIYVAADDGDNAHHRMFVLEGTREDPQAEFRLKGKLASPDDHWAIDGTVLETESGRYFTWSGWEGDQDGRQDLYMAPMLNPWTLGPRHRIATPALDWERGGTLLINEGPQVLRRGRDVVLVFSAGSSWTDDYCLGALSWTGGEPTESTSWVKHPTPLFHRTDAVLGPGHASFVKSPDGKEDWIVYHAAQRAGSGWSRDIRIQRFQWGADALPALGEPVPPGTPLPEPSGTPGAEPAAPSAGVPGA